MTSVHFTPEVATGTPVCGANYLQPVTSNAERVTCPTCLPLIPQSANHKEEPVVTDTTSTTDPPDTTALGQVTGRATATEPEAPKKRGRAKAAPDPLPKSLPGKYEPLQELRFVALGDATQLLGELRGQDVTVADVLTLARWIVNGDPRDDDGDPLGFIPNTQEGTTK